MTSNTCAVCGRPADFIFAFPADNATASAGVVYDGAAVCSPACARELRRQREWSASPAAQLANMAVSEIVLAMGRRLPLDVDSEAEAEAEAGPAEDTGEASGDGEP